jgi:hypothetical protein
MSEPSLVIQDTVNFSSQELDPLLMTTSSPARDHDTSVGGSLIRLENEVFLAETQNDGLRKNLRVGHEKISEFHAQLMLDNINLTNVSAELADHQAELKAKEQQMKLRLEYLFRDCQRLSRDNDGIVTEAAKMDTALKTANTLLSQQQWRQRDLNRVVGVSTETLSTAMVAKHKSDLTLDVHKRKIVKQHRQMWQLEDTVQAFREEVAFHKATLEVERRTAASPVGKAATGKEHDLPSVPVLLLQDRENPGSDRCARADCREVQRLLADAQRELHGYQQSKHKEHQGSQGGTPNRTASQLLRLSSIGRRQSLSMLEKPLGAAGSSNRSPPAETDSFRMHNDSGTGSGSRTPLSPFQMLVMRRRSSLGNTTFTLQDTPNTSMVFVKPPPATTTLKPLTVPLLT